MKEWAQETVCIFLGCTTLACIMGIALGLGVRLFVWVIR